jgi:hypothetical protein
MNPHSRPPPSPVGLPPIWGEPDMVSEEGSHAQRRRYMVMNQKEAHINVAPPARTHAAKTSPTTLQPDDTHGHC